MKLDRALIKSQAKQLISGNVFKLFIIAFVVLILTGGAATASTTVSNFSAIKDFTGSSRALDNFGNGENSIENFDVDEFMQENQPQQSFRPRFSFGFSGIISIFLAPLSVALAALFLQLIRGTNLGCGEGFSFVFKNAFEQSYLKRVLTLFLTGLFTTLWSLLFIIPGIVYAYKIRFVPYILADHPDMEWREAIDLSKKMTNGHKGELFVLDLSFIPWALLMPITLGLINIYVLPYRETVNALYYENFKQRGLQSGELNDYDFMSTQQKAAQAYPPAQPYQAMPTMQQPPYQAPAQPYQAPAQPYQAPAQPYQAPVQPYQAPPAQPYQAPQLEYYQPPVHPDTFTQPEPPAAPEFPETPEE